MEPGHSSLHFPIPALSNCRTSAFRPPRRGEVKHSLLVVANADLRYEHAKKRGPLTALLLAYDLFGDSFFEASCRLGGKTTGHFL
jgi:hypothetical protein